MEKAMIGKILSSFSVLTEKPTKYLTIQNDIKADIKTLIKTLYDFTKSQEHIDNSKTDQALQKLMVEEFDEEQIWQQIELQNSQCWDRIVWDVANFMSNKKDLTFPIKFPENVIPETLREDDKDDSEPHMDFSDNENVQDENQIATHRENIKGKPKSKGKASIVDDQFFKLRDMETFLLKEEKMEGKAKNDEEEDNESINMFEDIGSEGSEVAEGKEMMYSDFFNEETDDIDMTNQEETADNDFIDKEHKNKRKQVRFADAGSDDSDSDDNIEKETGKKTVTGDENEYVRKSEFELRQQRLKQTISRLEEKTLKEAPWQLKGEIDASKRPQNSLLEEVLDFDLTTRPPPIITEQTTLTLEGLIRQRIKDKAWDDVVKKEKPVDDQLIFKKPEVLDQSKSKLSLAQVYEAEYLKQKQALSGDVEDEKEPESHIEIRDAMTKLFSKLDALCHYHYTPKPPQAEVKIVSNTPAISMEEVAPVATSDATLLAPEEVKRKRKGELMSKEERTQTDKNRERRKKKKLQRKKGQEIKVTEHRNTKKAVEATDKSFKTSKAFFQQLNNETNSLIKTKSKKIVQNKQK